MTTSSSGSFSFLNETLRRFFTWGGADESSGSLLISGFCVDSLTILLYLQKSYQDLWQSLMWSLFEEVSVVVFSPEYSGSVWDDHLASRCHTLEKRSALEDFCLDYS